MSTTTDRPFPLLGLAAAAGVLGDQLLRAWPPGLGAALWLVSIAGVALFLLPRWHDASFPRETRRLLALAIVLGATLAWRDSPLLDLVGVGAFAATLLLAGAATAGSGLFRTGLAAACLIAARGVGQVLAAPFVLARASTHRLGGTGRRGVRVGLAVLRGLLIALPVLAVFGALLGSADAIFKDLALDFLDLDLLRLASHVGLIVLAGAVAAGLLVLVLDGTSLERHPLARPAPPRERGIEVCVVLGLVDLLFAGFVAVQFTYLFGGSERIRTVPDLTYAEYARHGFFELVAVAALSLPLLLLFDWVLRASSRLGRRLFRGLAVVQIALLFVVLASAFARMDAYQEVYGLTELRFYVTAFLLWLALVLVWCGVTVLSGRRERFLSGVFLSGALAVLALNAVSPDAFIARVNVERLAQGKGFDAEYAVTLGADAAPVLWGALEKMARLDRRQVENHLLREYGDPERDDWRALSWGLWRARVAIRP